jgi:hypothetical protein
MNVMKIAAVACAALLGASSFAMAGAAYGGTELVGQGGQPLAKVYIGSRAMASDGVAAAGIAAAIANEAYKSSVAAASKAGAASCTAVMGGAENGACRIDPGSKKVTLSVEAPGAGAGVHTFQTLITDSIDRTPANRNSTRAEDSYSATMAASDTSGSTASAIRAVETNTSKGMLLYRIGSYEFPGFADFAVVDGQAPSATYIEMQSFWVGSSAPSEFGASGVTYDSSERARDIVVNKYSAMAYSLKFAGNDFGIPVCTGDQNASASDDWASCDAAASDSRTDKHRLGVKFLGSDWVVSEMSGPSTSLASSTAVVNGGQVKLAREAKYGIINVGGELDAGSFKARLADISVATGSGNSHPAIIDVLDANGAVAGQIQVDAGTTYAFGSGANSVKIHVYKTAPGFTLNAKWAEMAIYTDEIVLRDGQRYNLVPSTDADRDFKVSLLWKNRDYTGTAGGNDTTADSLREIVVYNLDGFADKTLPGTATPFPAKAPAFKLTYGGVDIASDGTNYAQLAYSALSSDTYRIASSPGDTACGASAAADNAYTAKLVSIKTGGEPVLGGTGDALSGDYRLDTVYLDPIGRVAAAAVNLNRTVASMNQTGLALPANAQFSSLSAFSVSSTNLTGAITLTPTAYNAYDLNTTSGSPSAGWYVIPAASLQNFTATLNGSQDQSANAGLWAPAVFYRLSGRDCYNYDVLSYESLAPVTNAVKFDAAGEDSIAQSEIYFSTTGQESTLSAAQANIVFVEDAGYYGTENANAVLVAVPMIANNAVLQTIRFKSDSATGQAYYLPLGGTGYLPYEPMLVTERGSKVKSVGATDASIQAARWPGMPTFEFSYADAAAAAADDYVMGVGDTKAFGDVTLAVKAIDATGGSCSAVCPGGLLGCIVGKGAVAPENASLANQAYGINLLPANMVRLDSDGESAGVAILVGGPAVNTMTADALLNSSIDFSVDSIVVREMGNGKIVVAGMTAADTAAAAERFIAGIRGQ